MASVQEMCARIGLVTKEGLSASIRKNYAKPILYVMILFTFPAIVMNIGADIAGMGAVANLLIPIIPSYCFMLLFTVILMLMIIFLSYEKFAAVLKYLCLSLLLYIIVPFLSHQNWLDILKHTFIPTVHFDKEFFSILVAILGTTISPYLFIWQTTMESEDLKHQKKKVVHINKLIVYKETDVGLGMFFSNIVMYFIILTTGTVLYQGGIHHVETVAQAAKALEPLAGDLSYFLFAIGIIGTGFLAIPVLCGSLSYILSETFDWERGLDKKYYQAKPFYLVVIVSLLLGLAIDFSGLSPIRSLIYTAILYGLTAPVLIAIILHIANNKKIMGSHTNSKLSNIFGFLTLFLMTISAILLLYFQFQ